MQVTNLGDCGFRIFREGQCIFASDVSPPLQHVLKFCYALVPRTAINLPGDLRAKSLQDYSE